MQHSPHLYVIFWGSAWNESTGSALRAQLLSMYEGLSGSSYQGILTQYFDSTSRVASAVTVTSYVDEGVPAPTSVNDQEIREEAARAITAKDWPRELDSQFVVIPAPGSTYEAGFDQDFCGYHGVVEESEPGHDYTYTFIPYVGEEPFYAGCIEYDGARNADNVTSMTASHEYAESATDPGLNNWFTEEGYEIADICASGDDELPNGSWVQGLWDNHQSACSLSDPEPPHVNVVTEAGVSLEPHEVELAGVVDPEGLEAHYHFEYGATTSYGTVVPVPDSGAGSSSSNVSVSQTVKGLAEGVYHYRLVATNSSGTAYGEDRLLVSRGFSVQTLPQPADGGEERKAEGVSCVTPETCMAVGTYFNTTAQADVTLAESFNGTEWAVQSTPDPPEAIESELRGVSCASSTECAAVGYYKDGAGTQLMLAERWYGSDWAIEPAPNPSGMTEGELRGVSCLSSSECTAVGYYKDSAGAELMLAERWNGAEWAIQSTSNPSGAAASRLLGVSCSPSRECAAVGEQATLENGSLVERPLAEWWNGAEWSSQPTAALNEKGGLLRAVSCTASSACTAVGYQFEQQQGGWTGVPLAEQWSGSGWSIQATPRMSTQGGLWGVSCTSPAECTAVGSYNNQVASSDAFEVLGERWNGATWAMVAMSGVPKSSGTWRESGLHAVSCTEALACIAVGDTITAPFGGLGHEVGFAEREFAAPIVTTETTSSVTDSEAMLNGVVNPDALETHYNFEYGTTTSYGTSVPVPNESAGSAVSHVKASQLVAGLQPKTTYHDRLVASNAAGTTYGEDNTFTTAALPPSNISAPTISGSAVQGQALTETHGSWSSDPTSYAYQWEECDSTGENCSNIADATIQTYTLTATDVGYTIRVQETASNVGGTGSTTSSAATALVQTASSGGGSGSGSGGPSGGTSTAGTAPLATVSTANPRRDVALIPVSCPGNGSSSCTVTFTLTVVEKLRQGRLVAVSAAAATRRRASKVKLVLRTVIVGHETVTLAAGESEVVHLALNATGRRLLTSRHALAVKLTISENDARPWSQIIRFKAPVRVADRLTGALGRAIGIGGDSL